MQRKYTPTLAAEILTDFPDCDKLVLKIPDVERGQGVVIAPREYLDLYLRTIITETGEEKEQRISEFTKELLRRHPDLRGPQLFQQLEDLLPQWTNLGNGTEFMVEAYTHNKTIMHRGKPYDPTMRVAFIAIRDAGEIKITPLGSYWKMTPKPIGKGNLRDHTVSSFSEDHQTAIQVSQAYQDFVYQQLQESMPRFLATCFRCDLQRSICDLPTSNDLEKRQKGYSWLLLSNTFALHGQYTLSEDCLVSARAILGETGNFWHQRGRLYDCQREYKHAISYYKRATDVDRTRAVSFYRKGLAHKELEQFDKSIKAFNKAKQIDPTIEMRMQQRANLERRVKGYSSFDPALGFRPRPNAPSPAEQIHRFLTTM